MDIDLATTYPVAVPYLEAGMVLQLHGASVMIAAEIESVEHGPTSAKIHLTEPQTIGHSNIRYSTIVVPNQLILNRYHEN